MNAIFRPLPLFGMMVTIFVLSHQPGDRLPMPSFFGADKIAHFMAFGLLAAAALFAFPSNLKNRLKPTLIGASIVAFCILYGISDEYHQSFIPLRSVSAADVVADGTGAIFTVFMWLWRRGLNPGLQKEESQRHEEKSREKIDPGQLSA